MNVHEAIKLDKENFEKYEMEHVLLRENLKKGDKVRFKKHVIDSLIKNNIPINFINNGFFIKKDNSYKSGVYIKFDNYIGSYTIFEIERIEE